MPRPERPIERIGDRQQELAEIAYRAMRVRARHEPWRPRHAAAATFASYQVRNVTLTQPYARPTAHATSSGTAMFV